MTSQLTKVIDFPPQYLCDFHLWCTEDQGRKKGEGKKGCIFTWDGGEGRGVGSFLLLSESFEIDLYLPDSERRVWNPDNISLRRTWRETFFSKSRVTVTPLHGLINYIDTKEKCRHLKKITFKGTLVQVCVYLFEGLSSPHMTPYPSSHTVLYTCILYTYLHRATVHKAWSKIMTDCLTSL